MSGKSLSAGNLLIMPFGKDSLRSEWIVKPGGRDFDVKLLSYEEETELKGEGEEGYDLFTLRDFKWMMIHRYLTEIEPEVLERYERFFFPDDDIRMNKREINWLFRLFSASDLKMAQPSLTRDSHHSWPELLHRRFSGMRYVSAVELMCPMMKSDALRTVLSTFTENQSGWGIDLLWGRMIRDKYGPRSIGVFDSVQAQHLKPIGKGELYRKLETPAEEEMEWLLDRYGMELEPIHTLDIPENGLFPRLRRKWDHYRQKWRIW